MAKSIKEVFNEGCPDLVVNRELIRKLHTYFYSWANRNEDHISFFGGHLLGVEVVRFHPADRNRFFDDILEADDLALADSLHEVPAIVPTRKVSADIFNISCLWLVHAIYTSNLSEKDKHEAMVDTLMLLQCRFLTSIMTHMFPYPAPVDVAQGTYAALSKKFGLKVHGSWWKLLMARTEDILSRNSIHYKTYTRFDDDEDIVYMVNDVQGRIKDILKNIRDVFEIVRKNPNAAIRSSGNIQVDMDGVTAVKDKQRNFVIFRRYIHSVIGDKATFIREELTGIIISSMSTMPPRLFLETLAYLSQNSGPGGDKNVTVLVDETLSHAFDYLSTNRAILQNPNDIGALIAKMRALYMASRGSDPSLLKMRALTEKMVVRAVKTRNPSVIAAVRTGVLLYIVLRTFSMHHYTK